MKKLFYFVLIMTFLISCRKTTVGPQGVQGATGETGAQGQTGLSNQKIYFGKVDPSGWGNQIYFPTYSNGHDGPVDVNNTTFIIYIDIDGDSGTNNHFWTPMPYVDKGQSYSFIISPQDPSFPILYYVKNDGGTAVAPTQSYDLKLVLIKN